MRLRVAVKMDWLAVSVVILHVSHICMAYKEPVKYNETRVSVKLSNPNFIMDRNLNEIFKPPMPPSFKERFRQSYTPAWMDFCDPYHCNDYHRAACGLNRRQRVFKWFQSGCHIILNNECASFRGNLKYDRVDPRFCYAFITSFRRGCRACEPGGAPVCAVSSVDNRLALFRDRCALQNVNCDKDTFHVIDRKISPIQCTVKVYKLIRI